MRFRIAPRWLSALRLLALAVLVVGLMVRPALAAYGEAHELAHDPTGGHAHVIDAPTAGEDASEERSPGHALLHFAHCCGQLSVTITTPVLLAISMPPRAPLAAFLPSAAAAGLRGSPFRPPIRA